MTNPVTAMSVGGYACPKCGNPTGVTDSRLNEFGIRRRRKCRTCDHRFTTYETEALPAERSAIVRRIRALADELDSEPKTDETVVPFLGRVS